MLEQSFGFPQIAALLILLQRGLEELYSARNTKRLILKLRRTVMQAMTGTWTRTMT